MLCSSYNYQNVSVHYFIFSLLAQRKSRQILTYSECTWRTFSKIFFWIFYDQSAYCTACAAIRTVLCFTSIFAFGAAQKSLKLDLAKNDAENGFKKFFQLYYDQNTCCAAFTTIGIFLCTTSNSRSRCDFSNKQKCKWWNRSFHLYKTGLNTNLCLFHLKEPMPKFPKFSHS